MAEVNWENQVAGADGRLGQHSPIPTDEDGHGPVPDQEALGYSCSCGSRSCELDRALKAAWRSGIRLAAHAWPGPPPPEVDVPGQDQRRSVLVSTWGPRDAP